MAMNQRNMVKNSTSFRKHQYLATLSLLSRHLNVETRSELASARINGSARFHLWLTRRVSNIRALRVGTKVCVQLCETQGDDNRIMKTPPRKQFTVHSPRPPKAAETRRRISGRHSIPLCSQARCAWTWYHPDTKGVVDASYSAWYYGHDRGFNVTIRGMYSARVSALTPSRRTVHIFLRESTQRRRMTF